MHYLLFSARETYPSIVLRTPLELVDWVSGAQFSSSPPALTFDFEAPAGFLWPDYLRPNSAIPLFSEAMRDVLSRSGVSSIDYYPARVTNTQTGEARTYHAANVIGLVAAMDRHKSAFEPARRHPIVVRSIDKLVLNEGACAGLTVFRLAEYDLLIVVDERVASALGSASLRGVRIDRPEAWDGFAD